MSEAPDIPLHDHLPALASSAVESGASLAILAEIRDLLFCMRSDYRKVHDLLDE